MVARWLRQHWGIEVQARWVRGVTWDEDRSTVRAGTAPQVMGSLRNTALTCADCAEPTNVAEACRVTAFSSDRGLDLLTDHQITWSQAC